MAAFQDHGRGPINEVYVPLAEVAQRLQTLPPDQQMLISHEGKFIGSIELGSSGDDTYHFIVRPMGFTSAMLRTANETLALSVPVDGQVYEIDPKGVGGHFVQGVTILLEGHQIILPYLSGRNEPQFSESVLDDDLPEPGPEDTAILPPSIGVCMTGSMRTGFLEKETSAGSLRGVVAPGGRTYNQDLIGAVMPEEGGATLYVLDGNYNQGQVAAGLVSSLIVKGVEEQGSGVDALVTVGQRFREIAEAVHPDNLSNMGSCAVVADVRAGTVTFGHIGDSRGYLLRHREKGGYQVAHVTKDHSMSQEWVDSGYSAESFPQRFKNVVTRNITADYKDEREVTPEVSEPIGMRSGDIVLLASDGGLLIGIDKLLEICNDPANDSTEKLIKAANMATEAAVEAKRTLGKQADNYSIMIFKFHG